MATEPTKYVKHTVEPILPLRQLSKRARAKVKAVRKESGVESVIAAANQMAG